MLRKEGNPFCIKGVDREIVQIYFFVGFETQKLFT